MFGFNKSPAKSGLLQSSLHDQDDFYKVFEQNLSRAKYEVINESPFISYKRLNYLLPILNDLVNRNVKIVINTKHPEEQTSLSGSGECIKLLQDVGVKVLFTGGHKKLALIDKHILYVGSLNILFQNDSCEIMRRIDSKLEANRMINFIA